MNRFLFHTASVIVLLALSSCAQGPVPEAPKTPISEKETNFLRLGRNVEKGGDVNSAIDLYKQAIEVSKGGVEGHLALSRVYLEQGHRTQAKDVLLQAKKLQPNNPEVNLRLGKIAINRNEPKDALGYFEAGLKDLSGNVDLLNGKGIALDMLGRHEEAQIEYRQALSDGNGNFPFVENNLAMSCIMTGKYNEAIDVLQGIKNVEDSPVMRQNLALAYGLKGDMDKAREWGGKDLNEREMNENIAFYQSYVDDLQSRHDQSVPVPTIPAQTLDAPKAVPSAAATPVAAGQVEAVKPEEKTIVTPFTETKIVPAEVVTSLPATKQAPAQTVEPSRIEPIQAPHAASTDTVATDIKPVDVISPDANDHSIQLISPPETQIPVAATQAEPEPKTALPPHWRTLPWMTGDNEKD
ncbi:MAG: tetratricopeptide repeat protein [Rickettsiales bacterium]